jgi:hypothetical protein
MLTIEQGLKKLSEIGPKKSSKEYAELERILYSRLFMTPKDYSQEALLWIEKRLAEKHLGYMAHDQVNGKWGQATTDALIVLCKNYYIMVNPKNPMIGPSVLLCVLDGSIPSKSIIQTPSGLGKPLEVIYFSQRDSKTEHAYRMCFSSSCAMLLEFEMPGTLKGSNGDDEYLKRVFQYGDTIDATSQLKALASYGLMARFSTTRDFDNLDDNLDKGHPEPIGILHTGSVNSPNGFGHWIIVIGKTPDGKGYYVNDPYGELDMQNGGYLNANGKCVVYSKAGLAKRWMVGGAKGWSIVVS